jgi:hypothetical protein
VIYSYNKTNEMHKFLKFIFRIELCMFSDSFSVHHQDSSTVHTAIHTGYADCLQAVSITSITDTWCCIYSTRLLKMDRKPVRNM